MDADVHLTDGVDHKHYHVFVKNDQSATCAALDIAEKLTKETGREWRVISIK